MIVIIVDYEIEDHICTRFTDKKHFKEFLSANESDIYFIDVSDKTWNEFKTKNSKRLKEMNELIQKASYIFLIKKNYVKTCTYYPKDDDP